MGRALCRSGSLVAVSPCRSVVDRGDGCPGDPRPVVRWVGGHQRRDGETERASAFADAAARSRSRRPRTSSFLVVVDS